MPVITVKLLIKSTLMGCALGTLPAWPMWYRLGDAVQQGVAWFLLPGIMIATLCNTGGIHDLSWGITLTANCIFYSVLSYVFFKVRIKARRGKR
jgi:hypothetical protein